MACIWLASKSGVELPGVITPNSSEPLGFVPREDIPFDFTAACR